MHEPYLSFLAILFLPSKRQEIGLQRVLKKVACKGGWKTIPDIFELSSWKAHIRANFVLTRNQINFSQLIIL